MANVPRRIGVPWQVHQATAAWAIEELVLLFLEMFANVARVNQQNPFTGWGFNDTGSLIEDDAMRRYTRLLARSSPYNELHFRDHCAWVRRSVFASLQEALSRLEEMSGVPAPVFVPNRLVMYIVELFVTMANSVLDNANTMANGDGDAEIEEEQEQEQEEEEEQENEELGINRRPTIQMDQDMILIRAFPDLEDEDEEGDDDDNDNASVDGTIE